MKMDDETYDFLGDLNRSNRLDSAYRWGELLFSAEIAFNQDYDRYDDRFREIMDKLLFQCLKRLGFSNKNEIKTAMIDALQAHIQELQHAIEAIEKLS